jgi:type II secretory pathway pseudopilin PulG
MHNSRQLLSGISLLELMLSLTIITIFLISATRYYQTTQTTRKINNAVQSLQAIYAAKEKYATDNSTTPTIANLIANSLLPSNFTVFANPWGGAAGDFSDSIVGTKLQVVFKNVPTNACNNIKSKIDTNINPPDPEPDEIGIACSGMAPGASGLIATF